MVAQSHSGEHMLMIGVFGAHQRQRLVRSCECKNLIISTAYSQFYTHKRVNFSANLQFFENFIYCLSANFVERMNQQKNAADGNSLNIIYHVQQLMNMNQYVMALQLAFKYSSSRQELSTNHQLLQYYIQKLTQKIKQQQQRTYSFDQEVNRYLIHQ